MRTSINVISYASNHHREWLWRGGGGRELDITKERTVAEVYDRLPLAHTNVRFAQCARDEVSRQSVGPLAHRGHTDMVAVTNYAQRSSFSVGTEGRGRDARHTPSKRWRRRQ